MVSPMPVRTRRNSAARMACAATCTVAVSMMVAPTFCGRPVRLAGHRHQAAFRLRRDVVAGPVARRRAGGEAADRHVDQPGCAARAGHRRPGPSASAAPGPQVLHDHVGARDQAPRDLHAARMAQVERDRLLAAVVGAQHGVAEVAGVARHVAFHRFDLHHLGAEVAERHRGAGARDVVAEFDDADALQGRRRRSGSFVHPRDSRSPRRRTGKQATAKLLCSERGAGCARIVATLPAAMTRSGIFEGSARRRTCWAKAPAGMRARAPSAGSTRWPGTLQRLWPATGRIRAAQPARAGRLDRAVRERRGGRGAEEQLRPLRLRHARAGDRWPASTSTTRTCASTTASATPGATSSPAPCTSTASRATPSSAACTGCGPTARWRASRTAFGLTNGPCFSLDGRTLYVADSTVRTIWAYDYAPEGPLANRRVFVQTEELRLRPRRRDRGRGGLRLDGAAAHREDGPLRAR